MRFFSAAILTLVIWCCAFGQTYTINTFAGGGLPVNIPGTSASLYGPGSVVADAAGNLFIADMDINVIFRLDARTGVLTRFAGTGTPGFSGDNGQATSAQLNVPGGLALDAAGNLYIADSGNERVRKVANGVITTIAGNGVQGYFGDGGSATSAELNGPFGVAVDSVGNLFITDFSRIRKVTNGVITTVAGNGTRGYSGDDGPATSAQLYEPTGVAVDFAGNLYIADDGNERVRKVANGVITTVAGNGTRGYSGDNGPATSAELWPSAVAVDAAGNLYIADGGNERVRKVANGVITTVAGNGTPGYAGDNGPATSAQLYNPSGVALDSAGNLYIADLRHQRVRMVSNGAITTVAGNGTQGYSGDNGPAVSAQLDGPSHVAVDATGNLYITDSYDNLIRKVANGVITTVAGGGNLLGDNVPATSGALNYPEGVAVDSVGNLFIADTDNSRIRKVSNGVITTVAGNGTPGYSGDNGPASSAQVAAPFGVAVDAVGNLYVADTYNSRIRKISNGVITTVAGNGSYGFSGDNGPATSAQLYYPGGVAVDAAGNLYIADALSERIRKVANGVITTVAGNGAAGFSGDNGPATSAELSGPAGVAVDATGNLYIADAGNERIRVLTPSGSSCSATVSPVVVSVPASGANFTITVQTGSSCSWAIQSLPSWISFAGNAVQTGSGSVTLTAQANLGAARTAIISIAGAPVQVNQGGVAPLAITMPSTLPSGFVGGAYSQPLAATGGVPSYTWSILSGTLPPGLALSGAGMIAGTPTTTGTYTFTAKVADSGSSTATQLFSLAIVAQGTLARAGVFSQLAAGGGWDTTIWLINTSSAPVPTRLVFHGDDGGPLSLSLTATQPGVSQQVIAATLDSVVPPNTTLAVAIAGPASVVQGWADVLSSGALSGFAVFRDGGASEAAVPLQSQIGPSFRLAFDNTGGYSTGIALVNLSSSPASLTATVWDENGNQLVTQPVTLTKTDSAGNGHDAFMLPSRLAVTAGKKGIVQFQGNPGTPFTSAGALTGLGLKTDPNGLFTATPTIIP